MTVEEQRLAEQQAATRQRIKELQARLRHSEARQRAIDRKKYLARCRVVAQFVDTAGLLWCPDAVLEKAFLTLAEDLAARGVWSLTDADAPSPPGGSLRRAFASTSSASRTPAKWEDGEGEIALSGGEEENPSSTTAFLSRETP